MLMVSVKTGECGNVLRKRLSELQYTCVSGGHVVGSQ